MEWTGKLVNVSKDWQTGQFQITFTVNEPSAINEVNFIQSCEKLSIKATKHREKRSLDANAYAWVLMDKLAEKLGESKIDIYREYVKHIGGNSEIVCVKNSAVERLKDGWGKNGIGWVTDTLPSKIKGCTCIILYYGSSTYDTAQMSRLLDLIIQDCKEQGIPTETPDEIARLKALWGE